MSGLEIPVEHRSKYVRAYRVKLLFQAGRISDLDAVCFLIRPFGSISKATFMFQNYTLKGGNV